MTRPHPIPRLFSDQAVPDGDELRLRLRVAEADQRLLGVELARAHQLIGLLLADRADLGFGDGGAYTVSPDDLDAGTHGLEVTADVGDDDAALWTYRVVDYVTEPPDGVDDEPVDEDDEGEPDGGDGS